MTCPVLPSQLPVRHPRVRMILGQSGAFLNFKRCFKFPLPFENSCRKCDLNLFLKKGRYQMPSWEGTDLGLSDIQQQQTFILTRLSKTA